MEHSTDNCITICHMIQDLIDSKKILDPSMPNVARNPLPNHHVNAIKEDDGLLDLVYLIKSISKEVKVEEKDTSIRARESRLEELDEIDKTLQRLEIEKPCQKLVEAKYGSKIIEWMSKMNFVTGQGLGIDNQGITEPVQIEANPRRYGLGYTPGKERENNNPEFKGEFQVGMITFDWGKMVDPSTQKEVDTTIEEDPIAAWVQ